MTAGCTFFFSLSPVCFAGGSFFICRPTAESRGSYHTKEIKGGYTDKKEVMFHIVGTDHGADAAAGVSTGGGRNGIT